MNAPISSNHAGWPGPAGPAGAGATDLAPAGVVSTDRRLLRLAPLDNVLVATVSLAAGERLRLEGREVVLAGALGLGHKLAARDIGAGEKIIKYGVAIGSAVQAIGAGEHVHTQNMKSDYLPTYTWEGQREFFQHHA